VVAFFCLIGAPALAWAAEPIATTDGESPGTSLQVTELKVSNGSVTLKFTLVNDGAGAFSLDDTMCDHTDRGPIERQRRPVDRGHSSEVALIGLGAKGGKRSERQPYEQRNYDAAQLGEPSRFHGYSFPCGGNFGSVTRNCL
jgi:hypothetical protein